MANNPLEISPQAFLSRANLLLTATAQLDNNILCHINMFYEKIFFPLCVILYYYSEI